VQLIAVYLNVNKMFRLTLLFFWNFFDFNGLKGEAWV
jgi:hypothetical protein